MARNSFESGLRRYLTDDYLKRAARLTIGIAGCGGIGSNCVHQLVRCGFRNFILVDHDHLDASNLNRQFYFSDQVGQSKCEMLKANLLEINPDLEIETVNKKVTEENVSALFETCHVIIEGFDDPRSKKTIVESVLRSNGKSTASCASGKSDGSAIGFRNGEKLLVAISGIAGSGTMDAIVTRRIRDNFYIVGDFKSEVSDTLHPYAPGIAVAAAKQADVVFNAVLESENG